jgi:hypothetical protein
MTQLVDISEVLILLGLAESCPAMDRALALFCITTATGAVRRELQYDPVYASHIEFYPQAGANPAAGESVFDISGTTAFERRINSSASDVLQLQHIPVRSVVSLKVDYDGRFGTRSGSFGSSTAKTQGADFWPTFDRVDSDGNQLSMDGMLRSQGLWPQNPGSVRVEYYAGYKAKELRGQDSVIDASPIWEAACEEVVRRFIKAKQRQRNSAAGFTGPLSSERLGDYSYTVNSGLVQTLLGNNDLLPESKEKLSPYVNFGMLML